MNKKLLEILTEEINLLELLQEHEYKTKQDIIDGKKAFAKENAEKSIESMAMYLVEKNDIQADQLASYLENAKKDLKWFSKLSTERHYMHSSLDTSYRCFNILGHNYSTKPTVIDKVNNVIEKYAFPFKKLEKIIVPEIAENDDLQYILDYFKIDREDYFKNKLTYAKKIQSIWRTVKDDYSDMLREWFDKVNELTGSSFPGSYHFDEDGNKKPLKKSYYHHKKEYNNQEQSRIETGRKKRYVVKVKRSS